MTAVDISFAIVLALGATLAALVLQRAKAGVKRLGNLAALLMALLALAQLSAGIVGSSVSLCAVLVALAMASTSLTFTVYAKLAREPAASVVIAGLGASALAALGSFLLGEPHLVILAVTANVIALLILGSLHLRTALREAILVLASALCLVAGMAALVNSGSRALLLFAAAALLGIALAVSPRSRARFKPKSGGWASRPLAIRRKR